MSSTTSDDEVDYEGIPVLGVGDRRPIKVTTYIELHGFIEQFVKILEEVFEMGILKGTSKRFGGSSAENAQNCPEKW